MYSDEMTATLKISGVTNAINSYMYRCSTINICGTTVSNQATLTINQFPSIIATTPGTVCGTGTVDLAATATTGTLSWFASPTGGTALGAGTNFTTPSISTTTLYYVEADNGGCVSPRTAVEARVGTDLVLVSNPVNPTICEGESIVLTASNSSTYDWSTGILVTRLPFHQRQQLLIR